jgi:uracil-DNA glycosylase
MDRDHRLNLIASEAAACTRCKLGATRTNSVFERGSRTPLVAFVGEGPGENEDLKGIPFVGKAGFKLDKRIAWMGLAPGEFYICNAVKCRPPGNRKPEPEEIAACRPFLVEQLARVIVALGGSSVHALVGRTEGITRIRGQWRVYQGVPVMPTFHPSYLLREPWREADTRADLQAVMLRLGRTTTSDP